MGNAPDYPNQDGNGMTMGMAGYHLPPRPPPYHMPHPIASHAQQPSATDQWGAAQSLTFLKRGSPASEQKPAGHPFTLGVSPVTKASPLGGEITSMPSLASSSDGSPGEAARNQHFSSSTPEDASKRQDDALLLAAVAMTEFGQSPPPSSATKRSPPTTSNSEQTTPASSNQKYGSPQRSIDFDDSDQKKPRTRSGSKRARRGGRK